MTESYDTDDTFSLSPFGQFTSVKDITYLASAVFELGTLIFVILHIIKRNASFG